MTAVPDVPDIQQVTLAPGEFFFGGGYTRVHTLLGSCVAITMWHPQRRIGGMCHFLLPTRGPNQRLSNGHYADDAIQMFLREIKRSKTRPSEYQVKVFGGSNMFEPVIQRSNGLNVSLNNVHSAVRLLREHRFNIRARDVGGCQHRKIFLELWNGDVWVLRGRRV